MAFFHLSRTNYRGATSLLESGIGYLRAFTPECMGVDVQKLVEGSIRAYAELRDLGRERMAEFDQELIPMIRFVS